MMALRLRGEFVSVASRGGVEAGPPSCIKQKQIKNETTYLKKIHHYELCYYYLLLFCLFAKILTEKKPNLRKLPIDTRSQEKKALRMKKSENIRDEKIISFAFHDF